MNKHNMDLDKQNLPDNFVILNEEQKERIEKLDRLNSLLQDLKVTLKREGLLEIALDTGLDIDKFTESLLREMRNIATSEQQYLDEPTYRIEVSG